MVKPGKKQIHTDEVKDPVWRRIPAAEQAAYKLNVMLAEMEAESGNFEKAATYYLAALKVYFRTELYKQTMQCIRQIQGSRQNTFLYRLGKCLLFHTHQAELARTMLDKLSILDPSFLKPVQKIFQLYEDDTSADRRELTELIERTTRPIKSSRIVKEVSNNQKQLPDKAAEPVTDNQSDQAITEETGSRIGVVGKIQEPKPTGADDSGTGSEIDSELQISFEETGEHFTVHKDLPDSTSIDKETLDNLMDSLLNDE